MHIVIHIQLLLREMLWWWKVSVASHSVMYMHNYKASGVQGSNALIC